MKRLLVLILMLVWVPAHGHDLWLQRSQEGLTLLSGHRTGHSHKGEAELVEYRPEIVLRADCFDVDGKRLEAVVSHESPVRISGGCGAVFVLTSTGYWSKTAHGTKNLSKKNAQSPIKSWLSFESTKRIDGWNPAFSRPMTSDLEITPLDDPLSLGPDAELWLLVTLQKTPVQGATITCDEEPMGVTDKDGRVAVKIRRGGFQMIEARHAVPLKSDDADESVHVTNLCFEIGKSE